MDGLQRGSAAIVGVAESDLGAVASEMSPIDLMAQGVHRALADCGLGLRDVDGLLCATAQSRTSGLALAEYLGISPAFVDTTILGGSSFMFHVSHAQAALTLGLCKVAVIAYGSTQRTVGRRHASVREYNPYETPFRPFLPSTAYALTASRHMHRYGTTRAAGGRRRGGARMGTAQPGRLGKEAADDRRSPFGPDDQLSVHRA
jgi:acetyl-CoA acetyltransferase